MIVSCPECSSKYRVREEAVPAGGAKMKCPRCGKLFAAQRGPGSVQGAMPEPVHMVAAEPGGAARQSAPSPATSALPEWDAMMKAENLVVVHPDQGGGLSPQPSSDAGGSPSPKPSDEVSDPFANIDLTAPASQPLAGEEKRDALPVAAPPPPPEPPAPAIAAPRSAPPPSSSPGIVIRDRQGEVHNFKYLPPARQWVANHEDIDGLEVSIASAPFSPVRHTHAFADLSVERSRPSLSPESRKSESSTPQETFPPRPSPEAIEAVAASEPSLLMRASLVAAAVLAVLAVLFSIWQFELLPIEPVATQSISRFFGADSPLIVPPEDPEVDISLALRSAAKAEESGALARAVVAYRQALMLRSGDPEILAKLATCYERMGDHTAVDELRRATATEPQPPAKPPGGPATRP